MTERILVVEDEDAVARGLVYALELEGFAVERVRTAAESLEAIGREEPHLVLLDVRLPDGSGFDVCHRIRADGRRTPIIMLTARDEEVDKVLGLELGADDYVVKPYSLRELLSRIRAILRRAYGDLAPQPGDSERRVGDLVIDAGRFQVRRAGATVDLTPTEFRLLRHLASQPGRAFTRAQIIDAVWGYASEVGYERTVDVHVRHLREKIEDDPAQPRLIETVHGIGYRLRADIARA